LKALGTGETTLTTQFTRFSVPQVDALNVAHAAEFAAVLAPCRRRGGTRVTPRLRCLPRRTVGVAALGTGFGFGRDGAAASRASDERHGRDARRVLRLFFERISWGRPSHTLVPRTAEHQAHRPGRDSGHDNDKQASIGNQITRPGPVQRRFGVRAITPRLP
jgi:hypothetical protein